MTEPTRLIRSTVEAGTDLDVEYYTLPETWDEMTEEQQLSYRTEIAVTHQNNVAPCGASVVEVDDRELERLRRDHLIIED